jgi:hypothetical protein
MYCLEHIGIASVAVDEEDFDSCWHVFDDEPTQVMVSQISTSSSHQVLYTTRAPKIRELPISNLQKRMLFQGINKAGKAINSTNLWKAQHEAERHILEAQSEAIINN